jgi:hypothetical protein
LTLGIKGTLGRDGKPLSGVLGTFRRGLQGFPRVVLIPSWEESIYRTNDHTSPRSFPD